MDVLELSVDRIPVSTIAKQTRLAEWTVQNNLSSAHLKLGASNRLEPVDIDLAKGWLD